MWQYAVEFLLYNTFYSLFIWRYSAVNIQDSIQSLIYFAHLKISSLFFHNEELKNNHLGQIRDGRWSLERCHEIFGKSREVNLFCRVILGFCLETRKYWNLEWRNKTKSIFRNKFHFILSGEKCCLRDH